MSTKYKLVYFNARGLAETSRILLALAQEKYTDYRFPLGPDFKKEEFDKAKAAGNLDCSMGKLPLLEVETKKGKMVIPQSKSIERYLARSFGFMGSGELEGARIDAVCECVRDIKDRYQKIKKEPDLLISYMDGSGAVSIKRELEDLIKILDPKDKASIGTAIGNKLSLADVTIYSLVTEFYDNKEVLNVAGKLERIREIVMMVASRPEVSVWKQRRPKTPF
jgi:glutathione S-transferase